MPFRNLIILMFSLLMLCSSIAFAQLTPTNDAGVTMGHVHLLVPDPEAHKKLEAQGTKLDMAIIDATKTIGLKVTFVTDPIGTRIELTQGLAEK